MSCQEVTDLRGMEQNRGILKEPPTQRLTLPGTFRNIPPNRKFGNSSLLWIWMEFPLFPERAKTLPKKEAGSFPKYHVSETRVLKLQRWNLLEKFPDIIQAAR